MKTSRAIIATTEEAVFVTCKRVIAGIEGLKLIAHCPGLMELFSAVESKSPDLVLISENLTQSENFELVVTLLNTLDVRWARIKGQSSGVSAPSRGLPAATAGDLFGISIDMPDHLLANHFKSLLWSDKRPEPMKKATAPLGPLATGPSNKMILIGSSTGGIDALRTVVTSFGPDCPPTVIVQHTGQGFGSGMAAILSRVTNAQVTMFAPNQELKTGIIYIVAGVSGHVVLGGSGGRMLTLEDGDLVSGHRPSIDALFQSAVPQAPRVAAAILTGMGSDGVNGLKALREGGAQTFAQDKATSVVYGMPAMAWSSGAAMKQVALKDIGKTLLAATAQ